MSSLVSIVPFCSAILDEFVGEFVHGHTALSSLDCGCLLVNCVIDADRMGLEFRVGMGNQTGSIQQCVWRPLQNVRRAQRIFGERAINVSGPFPEILAPNLFSFDKLLSGFARFKIFPNALPIDIISGDFESVLSMNALTNYLQRVRPLTFSSCDNMRHIQALTVAYLAISGNSKLGPK